MPFTSAILYKYYYH